MNRFKKLTFFTMLFILVCSMLTAQTIKGKVINSKDQTPLAGATIAVKNSNVGDITNIDGEYTLNAKAGDVVVVSFIGFLNKEITIGTDDHTNVMLEENTQILSEVVVTALGIKKESKKIGYSTESVKVADIQQNRTINIMNSIQGKIAGLDITPPAAGAGSSTKIRLRGQSAFAGANNSPLIVVNGLPLDQGARGANGNNSIDFGDNMQQFNPDDVESMTVLKGATAAALYGARAANGAIIITTKTGQKNTGLGVEYNTSYLVDEALDYTDFQYEYGQGQAGKRPQTAGQAVTTGQFGWGEKYDGKPSFQFDGEMRPYEAQRNRIKDFFRNGKTFTNTIAFSGGNNTGSFRASFSNMDASGISPNNEYSKKIANIGVNQKLGEGLNLSVNANYTNEVNDNPPQVGVQGIGTPNFLYRMSNSIPLSLFEEKAVAPNGTERQTSGFQSTLINPYFIMPRQFIINKRDRILSTATLRYDITDWLYAQGRVNMDFGTSFLEQNLPTGVGTSTPFNGANTGFNGSYDVRTGVERQMNMDFLVGATKNIKDFSFDLSFGGNIFKIDNRNTTQGVTDFTIRDLYSIENGINKTQNYGIYREQINSLYSFAEIGYKSFAFLNITGRQDWFSVLNPQNNSYFYPSVSGSFVFSEILNDIPWLSYGKLRGSYADVGSSNGIGAFTGLLNYGLTQNPFNGIPLGTITNNNSPNPSLRPFSVSEREIGLELRLFKSRVNMDIAAYDKQTRDQILTVEISNASGYTGTPLNLGSLQNRGIELLFEVVPVQQNNLTWRSSFNTALNTTKVLALAPGTNRLIVSSFGGNEFIGSLVYEVGQPLNQLAAKTYRRNDKGEILLQNNGRLLASTGPDVLLGSALPKYVGGWNNTFTYDRLSLLVQMDYRAGGKVLSSSALNGLRQGHTKASLVGREGGVIFDGVKADGTKNTTPVDPQTFYTDYRNLQIADPFLFKSDFLRLRNITLTYDASKFFGENVKFIKGAVISLSCRNVALLKKYIDDLDPEASQSSGDFRVGYEQTSLPTTRTYGVNLNLKF